MKIDALNLNTEHFTVEHLQNTPANRRLIESFSAPNNAMGLEAYLKLQAESDENSNGSRTFLVKDAETGRLACYFSLRSGLIAIRREDDLFDTIPAIELANFAVNDTYRSESGKVAKVGAYAFRRFVQPIVKNVSDLVGVQCLYIYALPKERLIQYYASLGFMRLPSEDEAFVHSHVKPAYDRGCIFMYQGI
jgi:hypothetical protein